MSIEKKQPTEEFVETTDSNTGELSKEEADKTAGGHLPWDGPEGRRGEGGSGSGEGGQGKPTNYF